MLSLIITQRSVTTHVSLFDKSLTIQEERKLEKRSVPTQEFAF